MAHTQKGTKMGHSEMIDAPKWVTDVSANQKWAQKNPARFTEPAGF